MGHQYTPANTLPTDYTIPDSGDDDDAPTFNVALEALGDRTEYILLHGARLTVEEFTTPGAFTWTCPARCTVVRVRGVGGGGSAGGGRSSGGAFSAGGGSGGGGAKQGYADIAVTPGNVYNGFIASGGAGVGAGVDGNDGGDSYFTGDTQTVTFYGGGGGAKGFDPAGANYGRGGPSIRNGVPFAALAALGLAPDEGQGGWSYTGTGGAKPSTAFRTGGHAPTARGAAPGTDNHPTLGGFGGGGGGASGYPGSVAGAGGAGGAATGGTGSAGTLGAGSGGGGGSGSGGGDVGGPSLAGGDGAITLEYALETP